MILPVDIEVEECIATILEVTKLNLPWEEYQASTQIKCGDVTSRIIQITYKASDELKRKLTYEVSKFKYVLFLYGKEELKRRRLIE